MNNVFILSLGLTLFNHKHGLFEGGLKRNYFKTGLTTPD